MLHSLFAAIIVGMGKPILKIYVVDDDTTARRLIWRAIIVFDQLLSQTATLRRE